ncbi:energy transducer TonB [Paraburkholderia sp.]|uniref:energy transducer TonB n=1 Tax=Paraburkholderia sp. TaxID=1926495 RepID=UPI003D700BB0
MVIVALVTGCANGDLWQAGPSREEVAQACLTQLGTPAPSLDQLDRKQWSRYAGCTIGRNLRTRQGEIEGYPESVVSVRFAPDGAFASASLLQSSGNAAWDTATERAIAAASPLPHAPAGTSVTRIDLHFRPNIQVGLSDQSNWSVKHCTMAGTAKTCE